MSKGVFTFQGGTDVLIKKMVAELKKNGADLRRCALVEKILVDQGPDGNRRISGIIANGRRIGCRAVMSNSSLRGTVLHLAGRENFAPAYVKSVENVRLNSSSCQVYIGLKPGETFEEIGDLIFTSDSEKFSSRELVDLGTRSRTFSIYYPEIRPGKGRHTVVASLNGRYDEWNSLSDADYEKEKQRIIEESLDSLERFIPDIRSKVEHVEAATPRTIEHYTRHQTSFGTKFEGLGCSMDLPNQLPGLYHPGSVGIIMSGWPGSMNYGVIVSNKVDSYVTGLRETSGSAVGPRTN